MNSTSTIMHFDRHYQAHLKPLKFNGLQPKTIDAFSRDIRRIGSRFHFQIDQLTEPQLMDHLNKLMVVLGHDKTAEFALRG